MRKRGVHLLLQNLEDRLILRNTIQLNGGKTRVAETSLIHLEKFYLLKFCEPEED